MLTDMINVLMFLYIMYSVRSLSSFRIMTVCGCFLLHVGFSQIPDYRLRRWHTHAVIVNLLSDCLNRLEISDRTHHWNAGRSDCWSVVWANVRYCALYCPVSCNICVVYRLMPERKSFRAYTSLLYVDPRMRIYIQGKKV